MPTSAIALKKPTSGFATITFRVDPAVKSRAEAIFKERAAIRQGEADIAAGRTYSLDEVMAELHKKYGLSPWQSIE